MLTLVRWNTRVNVRGPMGRRMLRVYIAQSARLYADRQRLEAAFARRAPMNEVLPSYGPSLSSYTSERATITLPSWSELA